MDQLLPAHRDVFNAAYRIGVSLGRKFEASDMTIELRQAAALYAASYTVRPEGDDFMRDMQNRVSIPGFLTDGQSKGVLNVMMADARRRLAAKAPKATVAPSAPSHIYLKELPDGRYRVTLPNDESIALYIKAAGTDSKLAGSRVIATRSGGDEWMGVAHIPSSGELRLWRSCVGSLRDRVSAAVDVLDQAKTQDEWLIAGLAFAQEGSQCFICGRDLDTRESLTAGYGPTCADKHGLPWGAKAVPMNVRLAQAASAASVVGAPNIHPETGVEENADELLDLVAATAPAPAAAPSAAYKPRVSLAEAKARGYARTYEEIFGDDD